MSESDTVSRPVAVVAKIPLAETQKFWHKGFTGRQRCRFNFNTDRDRPFLYAETGLFVMAKPLIVFQGKETASFAITRIERSKIYGTRKRIALDGQGRPCTKAALTADGDHLLLPDMTAQGHFAGDGRWIPRSEMIGIDAAGNKIDAKPSTLGTAQALAGPVPPQEVLDLDVDGFFWLEPEPDNAPLVEKLKKGEIYKCAFSYTSAIDVGTAFLLANDEGFFAVVGRRVAERWVEEGEVFVPSDTEDDGDDLDFSAL